MYIVVGLGNPGEEYERTRHNVGRRAADLVAERVSGVKAFTPQSFMNVTGQAVAKAVKSKKAAEKLILIYDDLDLPFGTIRISYNRGSGGHKGVESVIKALKTREFIRIRIGVGRPKGEPEKFILGKFSKTEEAKIEKIFEKVTEAVEKIKSDGLAPAMTEFNK